MQALLANCFLAPICERGPLLLTNATGASPVDPSEASLNTIHVTDPESESTKTDEAELACEERHQGKVQDEKRASSTEGAVKRREPTQKIHHRLNARRKPRASNHAILGMPLAQYLGLVQWTARELAARSCDGSAANKQSRASPQWEECLRNCGIQPAKWCDIIEHFGDWFHYAVGREDHLTQRSERAGKKWLHGTRACRNVFT